jgi:glucose-6-phosphate isomerase
MGNWSELARLAGQARGRRISALFDDPARARDFSVTLDDPALGALRFDFSRTALVAGDRAALLELAEAAGLAARREAMFTGAPINETEGRAVLHTALRNLDGEVQVAGRDVMPGVRTTLARMEAFARDLRDGRIRGSGGRITDVVNIGIGGSDLGPAMAVEALRPCHDGPRVRFVSNVDGAHLHDALEGLNPATTLVIVASKTFTTLETMANARAALAWMSRAVPEPTRQFVALSTAMDRTAAFGIDPARVFPFEDWVGGRYSVWGPIGLSLMIAVGPEDFRAFLSGAAAMDRHFRAAPPAQNMPVMLALVGIWHRQVLGHATRAVIPYEQRLARLPAYLQQLEMESNGKSVRMDGSPVAVPTGPVVWGEPGTNGQHAFFQLLHQGTEVVPVEFLLGAQGHEPAMRAQHRLLVANCLAQAEALMWGRAPEAVRARLAGQGLAPEALERMVAHRSFAGNRPSTLLLYPRLTPAVLGAILALYEHRVFVEGVVLGINSFDQWGVELGKEMAADLVPLLDGTGGTPRDSATAAALDMIRAQGG